MYVIQKIFEFARETPDAPAFIYNLRPIGYRDFYRMISAVRRSLAARGLRVDGVAVVLIDNLLVAWLADLALRSLGLTTVSVRTPDELAGLASLDIVALVTAVGGSQPDVSPSLFPTAARIRLEEADWAPGDGDLDPLPAMASGDHILLTSATTGHYKMVLINAAADEANTAIGAEVRAEMAQTAKAQGYDFSHPLLNLLNLGLWTAAGYTAPIPTWCLGAGVIFHQGPDAYLSLLVPGIAMATLTPGGLSSILASVPDTFPRNDLLEINVTGGPLSVALARKARERLSRRVVSGLGSTESGGWATTPIETDEDLRWHRITPGRVVEVVDEAGKPLPPMQLGQVRILADNGFTGYLNDPEATATFLREGYFYPGDLGVLDGQGRLALQGRVTEVLSILGDKVPARPLEQALEEAFDVEAVCILCERGDSGEEGLRVVIETSEPISEARLREVAEAHLNRFPHAYFHVVERLPRNHMGKVERLKLTQLLLDLQQPAGGALLSQDPVNPAN